MARAALDLGRLTEAEEAAGLAESVARVRREGQMRFLAEEVMDRIRAERASATPADSVGETAQEGEMRDVFARNLLRMLQTERSESGAPVAV
jgi:hypothetical protein